MIDSHLHLWGAEVAAADWLAGDRAAPIRRPAELARYAAAAGPCGVTGAVVVTAEQSAAETTRLVAACAGEPLVRGVVGWTDLTADLDEAALSGLIGIRHSVVSEERGWLRRPRVRTGIARYARTGLVLELLVAARDLGDVLACAVDHPELMIVVDHLGNPGTQGPHGRPLSALWPRIPMCV